MAVIGSLSVKLGLITVEWDQATAKAKAQAKELQKALDDLGGNVKTLYGHWKTLGGAFSVGAVGMAALMQQTLDFSNEVKDLAKGFDLTVGKVLQFREAIKTSGGNAEGASKMLSTLFSKIQDAQGGNEAAISQFEQLGISFRELATLKPEEAIDRVFNALNNQSLTTFQRVKAVKEMLGKQGIGLAVDEVASKLNMSVEAFRKQEAAIKRLGDVSDNLKVSIDNLKLAFADVISPFARDGLVSVEKFKVALYAIGSVYILSQLMKLYEVLMLVRKALAANAALSAGIASLGGKKGLLLLGSAFAAYQGAKAIFGANDEEPAAADKGQPQGNAEADAERERAIESNRREIKAAEAKVALALELTRIERGQAELKFKALQSDKFATDLAAIELQRQQAIATLENARAQSLNKENLSQEQIRLINADYDQQREKANQKAKDDRKFLYEQDRLATELIIVQLEAAKKLNALEREAAELKFKSIGMDKSAAELASLDLQYRSEIARIDAQRAAQLLKINQTEAERVAITTQALIDRASAEQRFADAKRLTNAQYQVEIDSIRRVRQAQEQIFAMDVKAQVLAQNKFQMREVDVRLAEENLSLERTIAELRRQQNEAQVRMGQGEAYDQERKRIDDLISGERLLSAARKQQILEEEERRTSFKAGWEEAFRNFSRDATNYGKLGADLFTSAIGNMNSAIDNFVRTGKLNFKDFARSVIQDTLAMIMKFQAMQLVLMGLKALGVPIPQGSFNVGPMIPSIDRKAEGGIIDGPTLVGERGPELFVPERRGTVIPNARINSTDYGQSKVTNNNFTINAIDTQSFEQRLLGSANAIWAANQYAQKSLAVAGGRA